MMDRASLLYRLKASELRTIAKMADVPIHGRPSQGELAETIHRQGVPYEKALGCLKLDRLRELCAKNGLSRIGRSREEITRRFVGGEWQRFEEPYATWTRRLEEYGAALGERGSEVFLGLASPASEKDVRAVENELGIALPDDVRRALRQWTSRLYFYRHGNRNGTLPSDLRAAEDGLCELSLARIRSSNTSDRLAVDPRSFPQSIWDGKLILFTDTSGDSVALDLRPPGGLVFIRHDDGGFTPPPYAGSFDELMERWTQLACVGTEGGALRLFCGARGQLNPNGRNGRRYRRWLEGKRVAPPREEGPGEKQATLSEREWLRRIRQSLPEAKKRWMHASFFSSIGKPVRRGAPYERYRGPDTFESARWDLTLSWLCDGVRAQRLAIMRRAFPKTYLPPPKLGQLVSKRLGTPLKRRLEECASDERVHDDVRAH